MSDVYTSSGKVTDLRFTRSWDPPTQAQLEARVIEGAKRTIRKYGAALERLADE